jgi:hypothetical protein
VTGLLLFSGRGALGVDPLIATSPFTVLFVRIDYSGRIVHRNEPAEVYWVSGVNEGIFVADRSPRVEFIIPFDIRRILVGVDNVYAGITVNGWKQYAEWTWRNLVRSYESAQAKGEIAYGWVRRNLAKLQLTHKLDFGSYFQTVILDLYNNMRYFAGLAKVIPSHPEIRANLGPILHPQSVPSSISSSFSGIRAVSSGSHLADIDQEQTESDEDSKFFPKWGFVFAPIGAAGIWWSWDNIRSERPVCFSLRVFVASAILWMYGLARLITL